ncbi:prepilin-type N-terminal cleavage/methylation domain-containing protein [Jeotgalibacillus sp. R-1-5s-1]|uniref:prepilin-type N-terminal cleavage/methylation domain-containing protein n=1 Tax=Jeotgalibacillus sp. R-1-5s-1 TaxID=2555897 RepID=UPI00106B0FA3|nr:prepilin-type N-terminal cleavage/methylation domain-containing protein [Jeotgalibacillus sp. R-1-5s-1]TFD92423.1 prepilin-type N-terminal cleavage/methylation domain-containing protein [Jeotgalibacillus sp. R-1-5s-1]
MRKMFKTLKNQKGLTLVELLAVLVILAIIAAIAVPIITGIINDSQERADAAEALNVIQAAKLAENAGGLDCAATPVECTPDGLEDYIDAGNFTSVTSNAAGLYTINAYVDSDGVNQDWDENRLAEILE